MENIIRSFIEGPLPNVLVVSGVFFLFLSLVGRIGAKNAVDPRRPRYVGVLGVLGVLLLLVGLGLHLLGLIPVDPQSPVTRPDKTEINKNHIDDLKNKIVEIERQIHDLEEALAGSPQSPGPLHELQDIVRGREKRFEEIENMQGELRAEVEQLRLGTNGDPDAERRIEQLEVETIPDLEVEKKAVQLELQELRDRIRSAEERDELTTEMNALKKEKQFLQQDIDRSHKAN